MCIRDRTWRLLHLDFTVNKVLISIRKVIVCFGPFAFYFFKYFNRVSVLSFQKKNCFKVYFQCDIILSHSLSFVIFIFSCLNILFILLQEDIFKEVYLKLQVFLFSSLISFLSSSSQ